MAWIGDPDGRLWQLLQRREERPVREVSARARTCGGLLESALVIQENPMARHLSSVGRTIAVIILASSMAAQAAAPKVPAPISAAVADEGRPQADKDKDGARKPAESIAFAGIKKGEKVADLLAGGGYFTRIFSKVVGDGGMVYATSFPPRPGAPTPSPLETLAADSAYKNVKVIVGPPADIKLPEKVDVVWTALNYHDVENAGMTEAFNKAAFAVLKPGGTFIVIDHAAAPGSGTNDTKSLHRIDPQVVKKEVTAAGFKFERVGDFLANPKDDHKSNVHDESIRWHTDQFILKFSKPK
jgi:predicted methyltransferase